MKRTSGLAILSAGTLVLAGCGATASSTSASTTTPAGTSAGPGDNPAGAAPSSTRHASAAGPAATTTHASATCTADADAALVAIAKRIYTQAVTGRNEVASVKRLGRSTRLAKAVAADDPVAAQAAMRPLIRHQITAIIIRDPAGRILARYGHTGSYGPTSGPILDGGATVGSFTLSVSYDAAYTSLLRGLTGAVATFAPAKLPGDDKALPATAFPSGAEQISLKLPRLPSDVCGLTAADTRLKTIGYVGHNLAVDEQHGPGAIRTIHHAQRSVAFRKAIIDQNPHELWDAIVRFFRDSRYHVVRVRAWVGQKLVGDVGGPYVLDPAIGTIHSGGKVAGRFMLSIQDDTGYIKLMHRFTGARVVLRMAGKTVPGSNLYPGPAYAAGLSKTTYHGVAYRSDGFLATAFPASPLQVSLLVR